MQLNNSNINYRNALVLICQEEFDNPQLSEPCDYFSDDVRFLIINLKLSLLSNENLLERVNDILNDLSETDARNTIARHNLLSTTKRFILPSFTGKFKKLLNNQIAHLLTSYALSIYNLCIDSYSSETCLMILKLAYKINRNNAPTVIDSIRNILSISSFYLSSNSSPSSKNIFNSINDELLKIESLINLISDMEP